MNSNPTKPPSPPYPYRLMTPGPVPLPQEVLDSLALPMVHHRSPQFSSDFSQVLKDLKDIFATSQPVLLISSTGSGVMEAAITNTLSPGDEVLVAENGKFGHRWTEIAEAQKLKVHRIQTPEGHPLSPQEIENALTQNPQIKALMIQACETSTGTINPVLEISQRLRSHPNTLLIVDAITAIGAIDLKMDEWGLDIVVAGSQKAFMLPTGLGFIALSQKAWKWNKEARCPRFYFDLKAEWEANKKGQTRFSSSVSLIRALKVTLCTLKTKSKTQLRCQKLAKATQSAIAEMNLELFSQAPSPSITSIKVPEGLNGEQIKNHLFDNFNISIAGGQDQLKDKILRIGHLGHITNEDLIMTIKYLGKSLIDFHHPISDDTIERAIIKAKEELNRNCSCPTTPSIRGEVTNDPYHHL